MGKAFDIDNRMTAPSGATIESPIFLSAAWIVQLISLSQSCSFSQ